MHTTLSFVIAIIIFGVRSSHGDVLVYTTPNNQVNKKRKRMPINFKFLKF